MPKVYCLQHGGDYTDPATGIEFAELARPLPLGETTDQMGRVTKHVALSVADVPEADLDHFRARPWIYRIAGDGAPASSAESGPAHAEQRTGPWWDVVVDGERVNKKAMPEDDARALAEQLNAEAAG